RPVWWLGAVVPALAAVGIDAWFGRREDILRVSPLFMPLRMASMGALSAYQIVHILAVSILPLLLLPRCLPWRALLVSGMAVFGAGFFLLRYGFHMMESGEFPYLGNSYTPWGPYHAGEATIVPGTPPTILGPLTLDVLTLLGCLGGTILAAGLLSG